MRIRNVVHKGLRRLIQDDDASAFQPAAVVNKVRDIVSFIEAMAQEEELRALPGWRAHQLSRARKGVWSLSVTRNWRITFRIDRVENVIVDLNYEDYH